MKSNTEKPKDKEVELPGYIPYPKGEDIFVKSKKVENKKDVKDEPLKSLNPDRMGDQLDVPGSELDNGQEDIGSEDEENNYYSLGGDNHDDWQIQNQFDFEFDLTRCLQISYSQDSKYSSLSPFRNI